MGRLDISESSQIWMSTKLLVESAQLRKLCIIGLSCTRIFIEGQRIIMFFKNSIQSMMQHTKNYRNLNLSNTINLFANEYNCIEICSPTSQIRSPTTFRPKSGDGFFPGHCLRPKSGKDSASSSPSCWSCGLEQVAGVSRC